MILKRKRRKGGRIRKKRRRAYKWKELMLQKLLRILVPLKEKIILIGFLKVTMKTGRMMIALLVLKTVNSKRISNSSRCDCRLYSSRAAC